MRWCKFLFGASALLVTGPQSAHAAGQVSAGDTAWVLTSTTLVLLMIVPGLALFYGGLVRTKNTLSMLSQVFATVCLVSLVWMFIGYSLVFTPNSLGAVFGGFSKSLLAGVTVASTMPTSMNGAEIPEFAFVAYQMMFACIAPALIVGAFAERMRFPALLVFVVAWSLLVYVPLAHMTWYAAAPDQIADAARAVAQASLPTTRRSAEIALQATLDDAGLFHQWKALDFAGGSPVHISAGVSGLIGAILLGHRLGYGRISMAPHNLALTMVGGALLWVGWIGFCSGAALRANGIAALAVLNCFAAASAAALSWTAAEWAMRGKPSLIGMISGAIAGLVAVTPAAGYAGPVGAAVLGLLIGAPCLWFSTVFKERYRYDDALDVFSVHCIAGIVGVLATALLAHPQLGGTGIVDYVARPGQGVIMTFDPLKQLFVHFKVVLVTVVWSGLATAILLKIIDHFIGMRVDPSAEVAGLDITEHGERAYNS